MLLLGTTLGVSGGIIGSMLGASSYGIPGFFGGAAAGVIAGGIIFPFFMIGTGLFIGGIYHATGVIDINKL